MICEPVMGAGGVIVPPKGYYEKIQAVCRKYDMLFVADEVICGFGRLGKWFSYQLYDGVVPDLMPIGKGMNGCILPVGGVVASREIAEVFERDRWYSGSTWDGHPLVCATIVSNIEAMIGEATLVPPIGHHPSGVLTVLPGASSWKSGTES